MKLSSNVVTQCVAEYAKGTVKAIVIPEESFGKGFWARCKKLERSFYVGVSWMEAARLFERSTFEEMKGYDEENTGTEDFDLPQRIEKKYGEQSVGRIASYIYHNEFDISLLKTCKKKYYYAKKVHVYQLHDANIGKFKFQASPLRRYLLFFHNPRKLFGNPIIAIGTLFMKTCEYGFGGIGYLIGKTNSSKSSNE